MGPAFRRGPEYGQVTQGWILHEERLLQCHPWPGSMARRRDNRFATFPLIETTTEEIKAIKLTSLYVFKRILSDAYRIIPWNWWNA